MGYGAQYPYRLLVTFRFRHSHFAPKRSTLNLQSENCVCKQNNHCVDKVVKIPVGSHYNKNAYLYKFLRYKVCQYVNSCR